MTTLHEHRSPVVSISVNDDQAWFLTASRDGSVKGYATSDLERDVAMHSRFQVETGRKINKVCCLQNADYFAVAGDQGKVDIYEMSQL